jgi:hypothetical protein
LNIGPDTNGEKKKLILINDYYSNKKIKHWKLRKEVIVIRVSLNSQNPLTIPPASSAPHAGESLSLSLSVQLKHA